MNAGMLTGKPGCAWVHNTTVVMLWFFCESYYFKVFMSGVLTGLCLCILFELDIHIYNFPFSTSHIGHSELASKSLSLFLDPILTINVTAPSSAQNFKHIYTQAGTPTHAGLSDPLLSGHQVCFELSNQGLVS